MNATTSRFGTRKNTKLSCRILAGLADKCAARGQDQDSDPALFNVSMLIPAMESFSRNKQIGKHEALSRKTEHNQKENHL